MARLHIRPDVIGRPLADLEALYVDVLTLLNTAEVMERPDLEPMAKAAGMVLYWLEGSADLGVDPQIPCPPRSLADVEAQAEAVRTLYRAMPRDHPDSGLVWGALYVLWYVLDPAGHYPLERTLYRAA